MSNNVRTLIKLFLGLTYLYLVSASCKDIGGYNRSDFNYLSYKPSTSIGYYTGQHCDSINIDHIVSLKDAYDSGASHWSQTKKEAFANDRINHVPSCEHINKSKGSSGPSDFLRKSKDGKGLDYAIVKYCEYVQKYYAVKAKYGLSFKGNKKHPFQSCGIASL